VRTLRNATLLAVLFTLGIGAVRADVQLEARQRDSLGIATVTLTAAQVPRSWPATAQVIDPTPLVTLAGDLRAARFAAEVSRHELERSEQLHAADSNVSLKALEAARAQSLSDAGRAKDLLSQFSTTWGRAIGAMDERARERLIDALASGRTVLLRAETRADSSHAQLGVAHLQLLTGGERWEARVLGPAAQGASQSLGSAYLLTASTAPPLQPGRVLLAELEDRNGRLEGIKLPRSALVRWEGADWVFVEEKTNVFARRAVSPTVWLEDGCLVQQGVRAGERVVSVGAELLLAAESGAGSKGD
jgi:hypothetical protein